MRVDALLQPQPSIRCCSTYNLQLTFLNGTNVTQRIAITLPSPYTHTQGVNSAHCQPTMAAMFSSCPGPDMAAGNTMSFTATSVPCQNPGAGVQAGADGRGGVWTGRSKQMAHLPKTSIDVLWTRQYCLIKDMYFRYEQSSELTRLETSAGAAAVVCWTSRLPTHP